MIFGLDLSSPLLWSAFGSIVLANIVLSGDNAVVIAMAARTLPPHQRGKAIFWGSAAAIVMRILLTIVARDNKRSMTLYGAPCAIGDTAHRGGTVQCPRRVLVLPAGMSPPSGGCARRGGTPS